MKTMYDEWYNDSDKIWEVEAESNKPEHWLGRCKQTKEERIYGKDEPSVLSGTETTIEQGEEQQSELDWCKRNKWQADEKPLKDCYRELEHGE